MTDDRFNRLLDQVVPPIPERLRAAPLDAVRRRARRRTTLLTASATGAVVLAIVGAIALALPSPRDGAASRPGTDRTAQPTDAATVTMSADGPAISWQFARIDRTERVITVFANPAEGDCQRLVGARAGLVEQSDKIVITTHGDTRRANDCGQSGTAVPLRITLTEPVNGRPIIDATTGQPPPSYHDRDLPVIPAQWRENPTEYQRPTGDRFVISYTRTGGPDLRFVISSAAGPAPSAAAGDRVVLGGRAAVLVKVNQTWTVRWRSGAHDFEMRFDPSEGQTVTRAAATAVLGQLDWRT
jgi:hypothetical protein